MRSALQILFGSGWESSDCYFPGSSVNEKKSPVALTEKAEGHPSRRISSVPVFLLLVSLTVETLLRGLSGYLQATLPGGHVLAIALFLLFDLLVIILLFALIFRYLPDAKIAWRDVWIGACLTAVLFVLGKFVLALYLGSGAAGSAYGAASSLITLLLWIYYAAQILLFGAEFTQVYANTYGCLVEPKKACGESVENGARGNAVARTGCKVARPKVNPPKVTSSN